jgi:DNA polymerase-3 subunit delta
MSASAPIWLFTGPEIGERNTAIEQLRAAATKRSGALDAHNLYASDVRVGDVIGLLQNGTLFADARFVVFKNAELIKKKDDIELLAAWVAESAGVTDASLILVSEDTGVDKKIEALIPKDQKRIFWEMFENRKEQWIVDFFRKEGYGIEPDAVSAILDLVENNTDALKTACARFTLFYPAGYTITEKDTGDMLAHNREESPFTLFDALASGELEGAIEIYRKLSMSKESSPVAIVAGLTFCFRRLGDWHRLSGEGLTDEFSLKKAGFTSKRAIEQYRTAARRWDASTTSRALSLLASTDLDLRSTGSALQDCLMETFLYSLVKRGAKELSRAEYD